MCDLLTGPSRSSPANTLTVCAAETEKKYFQEVFHTRTTFYVNQKLDRESYCRPKNRCGQMYVECLEPLSKTHDLPIVLIHDDFQTGQIFLTKPDGNPGWASFFLRKGYSVYIPDLPYCGRSNYHASDDSPVHVIPTEIIERELTATAKSDVSGWERCKLHDKWPGTGMRNDEIFENFRASLTPMTSKKVERESLSQSGLKALLQRSGKALLVGVGSGAVAAWLAGDVVPDLVAGVIAIEPSGPPCGIAFKRDDGHDYRTYSPFIIPSTKIRKYGIADIPLTYFPPLKPKDVEGGSDGFLMDISFKPRTDGLGSCARQDEIECPAGWIDPEGNQGTGERKVRKLIHLRNMRHVVVTSHSGLHTNYDWATVNFLKDAGLDLRWMKLEDEGIFGNGHLMFLEENSDQIASKIFEELKKMERVLDIDPLVLTKSAKRRADQGEQSNKKPLRETPMAEPTDRYERVKSESVTVTPMPEQQSERPTSLLALPPLHHTIPTTQNGLAPLDVGTDMPGIMFGALNANINQSNSSPDFPNAEDQLLHDFLNQNSGTYAAIHSPSYLNSSSGTVWTNLFTPSSAQSDQPSAAVQPITSAPDSLTGNITTGDTLATPYPPDDMDETFPIFYQ